MDQRNVNRRRLLTGTAGAGLAGAAVLASAGPAAAATSSLDWFNVMDAAYGAVGNGTADDTAAIQGALDAARSNGGGVVYFPYGHYLISSSLTVASGTLLRGECLFGMYPSGSTVGAAPTILAAPPPSSPSTPFNGLAAIYLDGSTTALNSIRIEGIVFNGSNLTTGTTAGILLNSSVTNVVLSNVVVSTFPGTGFSLQGTSTTTYPVAYFERCTAWQNGGHGFDLYTADCEVTGCMAFKNTLHGFNLQHVNDVQFIACRAEHNGENGFTFLDPGATSTIVFDACTTDQNNQNGIAVSGAQGNGPVQITGCSLRRDGNGNGSGSTTYAGLAVTNSTIPVIVTGTNVQAMRGDNAGYGPHYALKMTGSSFVSVVGGYLACEAAGSVIDWDGAGSLQLSSGVLEGISDNTGFPGKTTTTAQPSPYGAPPPSANGFIAWTADPWIAPTSASVGVASCLYLNAVYIQSPARTSKLWFQVAVAGAGAVSGENWAGLYNSAGQLLASVAIDSAVTSTGLHSFSWTTPAALVPGMYWIGILFNASTMPQVYRSSETLLAAINASLAASAYRSCIAMNGTSYPTLPSSISPTSNAQAVSTNDAQPYWLAIS